MRKSTKKQPQVQMIQRTVTSRNVILNNGNIKKFWEGSCWFAINAWGPFIFYNHNQENGCLENYKCVQAFKHRPGPIDQVLCTRCMLVAVLATSANSTAWTNHANSAKHV